MKSHPLLFKSEMINAMLDGRKTQTRRIFKMPKGIELENLVHDSSQRYSGRFDDPFSWGNRTADDGAPMSLIDFVPYREGDLIWPREDWRIGAWRCDGFFAIDYAADNFADPNWKRCPDPEWANEQLNKLEALCEKHETREWQLGQCPFPWRRSMHMPRWANRLTLKITEVRVERLQAISEHDAIAEGCRPFFDEKNTVQAPTPNGRHIEMQPLRGPIDDFTNLWNSINEARGFGWDSNPWVIVLSYDVHRQNVDHFAAPYQIAELRDGVTDKEGFDFVIQELKTYYSEPETLVWLKAEHIQLHGETPLRLLQGGRWDLVMTTIERLKSDGYL